MGPLLLPYFTSLFLWLFKMQRLRIVGCILLLRTLHQESSLVAYNSEISKDLIHSEEIITKEESLSAIRKRSEWLLVNSIKKVENGKNS